MAALICGMAHGLLCLVNLGVVGSTSSLLSVIRFAERDRQSTRRSSWAFNEVHLQEEEKGVFGYAVCRWSSISQPAIALIPKASASFYWPGYVGSATADGVALSPIGLAVGGWKSFLFSCENHGDFKSYIRIQHAKCYSPTL
jgi:hypothetical protein